MRDKSAFLPVSREEMDSLGWDELDILIVSGDAIIDHPAFGAALIGRLLAAEGFRVGVIAQPRWDNVEEVKRLGRPRLFTGITAGAMDSMLAHYTAFRKKRRDDAYTPGGLSGARPNRACIVYSNLIKRAFPGTPVVLGGIEASLRRLAHYDFWTDKLRRGILFDSKADLLIYGMAERAVLEVAARLDRSLNEDAKSRISGLKGIPGTVFIGVGDDVPKGEAVVELPSFEDIQNEPALLMKATHTLEKQIHQSDFWVIQQSGDRRLIAAPPAQPLTTGELDALYELPFRRKAHPSYKEKIPALEMIMGSVTSHRGCGGGCSFCSLALHQGRRISSRSAGSIQSEIERMAEDGKFSGAVTDVGGPTANMWGAKCRLKDRVCQRESCLYPKVCRHFKAEQKAYVELLRAIERIPGVKHVRVSSGVRFDLALKDLTAGRALIREFVGGQLKIAPEHLSDEVLKLMRKPGRQVFEEFLSLFDMETEQAGKKQYVTPYLMSAFPGCNEHHMRETSNWLKKRGWKPRQVQCFIPTPGSIASAMYYGGVEPSGRPVFVAKTDAERLRQHSLLIESAGRPGAKTRLRNKKK